MNFTNQRAIIIGVVIVLILAAIGTYFYQQSLDALPNQTSSPSPSVSPSSSPSVIIQDNGITVEGGGSGGLIVCSDACGDGTCQKEDLTCEKGSLNCVCAETKQDCPSDCPGN